MTDLFRGLHARTADSILTADSVATLPAFGVEGDIRYVKDVDQLYTFNGSSWSLASAGVTGGGSSTDNAIARWDGTTGAAIQNSGVLIDDSNNVTGATSVAVTQDPTTSLQLATKQYVDAGFNGLKWKTAVRVATAVAGTLATSFANGQVIDGVTLATGDRILLKDQVDASEDGIRVVAASGAPARASDAATFGALNGAVALVQEGTANANKGFQQITELTSFAAQSWVQNFGTGLYTTDNQGLALSGSTFSLTLDGTSLVKSGSGLKVNITGAPVGTTDTQALTNKTISGASNTITNVSLTVGVTGVLPIANGGTGGATKTAAFNALSPETTKGDLEVHNGTDVVRLPVGTDGYVLRPDSGQAAGIAWSQETAYDDGIGFVRVLPTVGMFLNNGRSLSLGPDTNDAHFVELKADPSMVASYTLAFPPVNGSGNQSLLYDGSGHFAWYTPFTTSSFTAYETTLPMKKGAYAASTVNIADLTTNPGIVDGIDFSFGGVLLLKNQTDPSENGLWQVPSFGAWTREATMPDNSSSAYSAIVPVNAGGTVNGNTIWYSQSNGDGNVPFVQIPTTASNIPLTASRALVTQAGGFIAVSATTATELGYVAGVSSSIQTQLNAKLTRTSSDIGANKVTNKDFDVNNVGFVDSTVTSKRLQFDTGNATASTTTILSVASTASRVLTLPDATTTLVGTDTTQTLSNKTLDALTSTIGVRDTSLTIQDDVDPTRKFRFQAGTIATGTTRTLTIPDANDTLVVLALAQTLTNKTIAGGSNTITGLSLTTAVTGVLPTANGGTNVNSTATFPASGVVVTEAATETLTNKDISGASNTYRAASTSTDGAITTGTQSFAGDKTMTTATDENFTVTTTSTSAANFARIVVSSGNGTTAANHWVQWLNNNTAAQQWRMGQFAASPLVIKDQTNARTNLSISDTTGAVALLGTNTNDSASSGQVGEELIQSRLRTSSTSLTSGSAANMLGTALTLTAGDWDICGLGGFQATSGSTAFTSMVVGISVTSATQPADSAYGVPNASGEVKIIDTRTAVTNADITMTIPPHRVSLSATTTFYLVITASFTVSTASGYGFLRARRVR